ncbi:MAG: hypothetical protein WBG17_10305 [Burkholderiaceae bacterium]
MKIPCGQRRKKARLLSPVPGPAVRARHSMPARRLPLAYMFAALGMIAVSAPSQASEWVLDQNGCKLWNPNPLPGETITWSGACEDGYAEGDGVAQWFVDGVPGSSYTGSTRAGKSHGRGFSKYRNGNSYEGDFVDGKADGKGVFIWADGARYEGDYVGGVRTGKGVYTWTNGDRYEGDYVGGERTGKGVYTWTNGDRYEGDYVNGEKTGKGVFTWADGERYEGGFVNDVRSGTGVYTWADGTYFEGEYVNGKRHDGRQFDSDGQLIASYSGGRRTEHTANKSSSSSEFLSVLGAVAQGLAVAAGNRNAAGLSGYGSAPIGSTAGSFDRAGGTARPPAASNAGGTAQRIVQPGRDASSCLKPIEVVKGGLTYLELENRCNAPVVLSHCLIADSKRGPVLPTNDCARNHGSFNVSVAAGGTGRITYKDTKTGEVRYAFGGCYAPAVMENIRFEPATQSMRFSCVIDVTPAQRGVR